MNNNNSTRISSAAMGKTQASISEEALAEKRANLFGTIAEEPLLSSHRSKSRRKPSKFRTKVKRKEQILTTPLDDQ